MFDLIVKNGIIADGNLTPRYKADIGIKNGRIACIKEKINDPAKEIIDAENNIVSPGFIDIHSHSDICPFLKGFNPQSKLFQGITLEIIGNCGISNLPITEEKRNILTNTFATSLELPLNGMLLEDDSISDYIEHIKRCPAATNIGVLIGHGTLRGCVMGLGMKKASSEEIQKMKELLDRELSRGAFGMSLGLIYPPSSYGNTEEFIELAKILKKHEALLTVHLRSESTKIFEAVDEMIEVAEKSNVHLQISHLKLIGKPQWGKAKQLLDKIKAAKKRGINITCDQYPYLATSTGLSALVPKWALDGGAAEMCKKLSDPSPDLIDEINAELERRGGANCVLIVSTHGTIKEAEGKYLDEVALHFNITPALAVCKLLNIAGGGISCCYFSLSEQDMLTILKENFIAVGTDGYAFSYDKKSLGTNPHPRSFGTFPRYFQTVREHNLMSLEEAVYKATALPADILGIKDRGRIEVGKKADITIFNALEIEDKSTYTDSLQKPAGIKAVIIDGIPALVNGNQMNSRFGHVIIH